jgi:hypothetical protein
MLPRDFNIRIPAKLGTIQKVELVTDSRLELASAIAPTVEHMVAAAGITLPPEQVAELNRAFIERGTITIEPGGTNMSATVSVEVNSLNYTSKPAALEAIRTAALGATRTEGGA